MFATVRRRVLTSPRAPGTASTTSRRRSRDVTFVVLDLETTGTSPDLDAITEVGAVKYRGGECLGTFDTLVNPGVPIPPFITVLTGITEAMVLPAPRDRRGAARRCSSSSAAR